MPAGLAAALPRVPLLVHEQNAVLGRANRLIARDRPGRGAELRRAPPRRRPGAGLRAVITGNPVRAGVRGAAATARMPPAGPLRLLVVGGSQGARIFSDVLPAAVGAAARRTCAPPPSWPSNAGPRIWSGSRRPMRRSGFAAELASFFDDVPDAHGRGHLVIARSGASTVAELLALGRPALLVPYPFAADDHQTANARALAAAGAAVLVAAAGASRAERCSHAELERLMRDARPAGGDGRPAPRLGPAGRRRALADAVLALAAAERRAMTMVPRWASVRSISSASAASA